MFDGFGEFNSADEINLAAEGLIFEKDIESLYKLAEENGIERYCCDIAIESNTPIICDTVSAAIGKLDIESHEMKLKELMVDWVEYIKEQCFENEAVAKNVRNSKYHLEECISRILAWSFKNAEEVPKKICEAAGIKNANVKFGIPGMKTVKKIIDEYYGG